MLNMELADTKKCRAIVMFGPATETSGMRPGVYYQVTIDPSMVSPSGEFIRFGAGEGDEITGWQRVDAMTICEILGEYTDGSIYPDSDMKEEPLKMMRVVPAAVVAEPIPEPLPDPIPAPEPIPTPELMPMPEPILKTIPLEKPL